MTIASVSQAVGVSESTLSRVFRNDLGLSAGAFIRRMRLELACRSIHTKDDSILQVALSCGFEDHSAFTRSFKKLFGFVPIEARKKLNIVSELEHVELEEPDFVELEAFTIQSVTEQGLYFECAPNAWRQLRAALSDKELSDAFTGMFIGIGHDNPHEGEVEPDQVRFTAGVAMSAKVPGMTEYIISGGRYARFHFVGMPNNLGLAYHYIYGQWQDKSKRNINHDRPAFIMFSGFPEASAEQRLLIHVPIE